MSIAGEEDNRRHRINMGLFTAVILSSLGIVCAGAYLVYVRTGWTTDYFHWMALGCLIWGFLLSVGTAYSVFLRKIPLLRVYPWLAIGLGLLMYFILPVYMKPDDSHHGASAYELSNQMLGATFEGGSSVTIRRACDDLMGEVVTGDEFDGARQMLYPTVSDYNKVGAWFAPTDNTKLVVATMTKYKWGHRLPYLLSALGLTIARILGWNFGWGAFLAAMLQMLFFTFCNAYAMRRTPLGKSLFVIFGMLPIVMQQVTSFSYEGALFAGCVIVTSLTIYIACEPEAKLNRRDWLMYLMAAVLLITAKSGVYAPLLLLPIFMGGMKASSKRKKYIIFMGILCCIAAAAMFMYLTVMDGQKMIQGILEQRYYNVYTQGYGRSLLYFLGHPGALLQCLMATLGHYGLYYASALVGGTLGWRQDIIISGKVMIVIYLCIALGMVRQQEDHGSINGWQRLLLLMTALFYSIFILVLMLVRWTDASAVYVEGVQGRYFLPVLLLALFALGFGKHRTQTVNGQKLIMGSIPQEVIPVIMVIVNQLVLCVCVWMTCLR